jgi:hypothetical protein
LTAQACLEELTNNMEDIAEIAELQGQLEESQRPATSLVGAAAKLGLGRQKAHAR